MSGADIVERLLAPAYWMSGSSEGHEGENDAPREAAATITALRAEVERKDAALEAIANCPKPSFLTAFNPEEFMRKTALAAHLRRGE